MFQTVFDTLAVYICAGLTVKKAFFMTVNLKSLYSKVCSQGVT